ncbi:uncharacterized protein HHUB_3388 [Halobacterium hubeiense]|uniref:DUF7981 domain-containing protein n=2 Tax=Halobacterium TaxID=2239 RepID=A0A0U5H322_9EURY|nr:hypothetical protein [Halobacterium hubeiense]CQH61170.1 uncharacterized protein HHUB_3388 [Halobacterium hubeiense]
MDRSTLDTLAWGAVGALAFLVLAQGYRLFAEDGVGFLPLLGVAVVVFAASSLVAHLAATRLR